MQVDYNCVRVSFAKRYIITLLAFVGIFLMIALRTNLSMALPQMTSAKNVTMGNETVTIVSIVRGALPVTLWLFCTV